MHRPRRIKLAVAALQEQKIMESSERPKRTISPEELAGMIRDDLSKVNGCPKHGVNVTVYGIPWKAMLMFGAEAVPNKS